MIFIVTFLGIYIRVRSSNFVLCAGVCLSKETLAKQILNPSVAFLVQIKIENREKKVNRQP